MRSDNNKSREVVKDIVDVIKSNEDKNIKWICGLKNKWILFTYYLKVIFYFKSHH